MSAGIVEVHFLQIVIALDGADVDSGFALQLPNDIGDATDDSM